jgi:predicted kinase
MQLENIVDSIDDKLAKTPFVRQGGSLLMMIGLPGVGKTSIVTCLQKRVPCVWVATDNVRAEIRARPMYTAAEVMFVYEICYEITERRLRLGQRVVFDGSNYLAARRDYLADLARRNGAPVTVCVVQAAQEVIRRRLLARSQRNHNQQDKSDADWSVYKWMVEAQEPVVGEHLILDTTATMPDVLAQQLYTYWMDIETTAASDPDLQSPRWASKLGPGYRAGS